MPLDQTVLVTSQAFSYVSPDYGALPSEVRVTSPVTIIPCTDLQPNCVSCSTYGEICNECDAGYYIDGETQACGYCNDALLGCGSCNDPTECLSCAVEGFELNEDATGCVCPILEEEAGLIALDEETGMCKCAQED